LGVELDADTTLVRRAGVLLERLQVSGEAYNFPNADASKTIGAATVFEMYLVKPNSSEGAKLPGAKT